ncbi:MAG: hypothetical protein ABI895_11465 [Deltaproteobacteria bacterium]
MDDSSLLRQSAEELLLRDLDRNRVLRRSGDTQHSLNSADLRSFWRKVDDALEEAWVGHGFAAAERLKREWRSRERE